MKKKDYIAPHINVISMGSWENLMETMLISSVDASSSEKVKGTIPWSEDDDLFNFNWDSFSFGRSDDKWSEKL